ncbi:decapping and exoribonuclease protein [Caerostris extrusa]|uniref:Decapping nuclease n=1 Tax=Caerostris extrusa TaxID=172846 RepID=A0AAV4XI03_CAEEX|nr:decapping and exoribonuclease protein [Caerostris extrusa]
MTTIKFSAFDSEENDLHETPFEPIDHENKLLFGKPTEIDFILVRAPQSCIGIRIQGKSLKTSKVDFISVRGTLALIMCTPYIDNFYHNSWEICASKYNGVIYLSAIDSDEDIISNKNTPLIQLKRQSWGFKFEQYITTDTVDGVPDISSKTHQLEEYCVVLKSILNSHTLLYKAEIDAVIPHRDLSPEISTTSSYVEIKTIRSLKTENEKYYFYRYKMAYWWAQSYLAGISEIICGNRTDAGIINSIDVLRVSNFPKEAHGMWSPDVCLNFCDKFLNFLKRVMIEDDPNVVYKFSYKGKDKIYCTKLVNPENRYRVIPKWYTVAFD